MAGLKVSGSVVLASKVPPGSRGKLAQTSTNIWSITPTKNFPIYRYDIRILEEFQASSRGEAPMKEVTKQTREDYISIERKNKCVAIYLAITEREAKFFHKRECLVYDRASILYSIDQLDVGPNETKSFVLSPQEFPREVNKECVKVHFNIKRCTEDFQLTTNDLKRTASNKPAEANRSLLQFFELLLSQEAFFTENRFVSYGTGQNYLYNPYDFGFDDRDMPELPDGKYIGIGVSKGVRMTEGGSAALVMDVKKAAFHIEGQVLVDKVAAILNVSRERLSIDPLKVKILSRALRGIYVRCTYGKKHSFPIYQLSNDCANKKMITLENKKVSVAEYFRTKYGIPIDNGNLPLVIEKKPQAENFYPMELLIVCENQRVSQTQQSSQQVQVMIKACASLPQIRIQQTKRLASALQLDQQGRQNAWLKETAVKVSNDNLSPPGRVLPMPQIVYSNNATIDVKENTSWLAGRNHYLFPASCDKWYVVALIAGSDRFFNEQNFKAYIDAFSRQCRNRGMQLGRPVATSFVRNARPQHVSEHIKKAKQAGATFVHFVTSESLKFQGEMKLVECQEQLVTQNVKSRTAGQAPQKWQTMDNIVNKTNLKLGGLNFELRLETPEAQKWISNQERLVVGIDMAHPPAASFRLKAGIPSVVGYSANCKAHPLDFIGAYRYARAEMEQLLETDQTICELMCETLKKFLANRKKTPTHLIVLRDGVSEGQYTYVRQHEVQQVMNACKAAGGDKYKPHITYIVATKKHNVRLYRKSIPHGRAAEQNILPGTTIDKQIVNPALQEFYLNSHSAFQGTAKTPRYNMIFDSSKMSADEMEGLIYALAFNHQIVNAAVSLPAPIIIANRMASRGRNNFIARFGDESESTEAGGGFDLDALNSELGYMNKPLSSVRFNA